MIRHKLVPFRDMCGVYVLSVITRVLKYQVFSGILSFLLGET